MTARGVAWLGVRTERFDETRRLFEQLTGASARQDEHDLVVFDFPNGDRVEIFGPSDEDHTFTSCPIVGFLVDDVGRARAELEASGIEFVGPIHRMEGGYAWSHFRGPDGNYYELTEQPDHPDGG